MNPTTDGIDAPLYTSFHSLQSILPTELLDYVLEELSQRELLPVVLVNRVFYTSGIRRLYRKIDKLDPKACVLCLQTLSRTPTLPPLVRKLEICIPDVSPTGNLYRLIHNVLIRCKYLTTLFLELPRHTPSACQILEGCSFALKSFMTSMEWERPLAQFLDIQPSITKLTLRGLPRDGDIPNLFGAITPPTRPSAKAGENQFCLLSTSLPKLSTFNAIHGNPSLVAKIVSGRPVTCASIPLHPLETVEALDALAMSSLPLKRLTLMCFDRMSPGELFTRVSKRFSDLEALHIIVLMTTFSKDVLEASGPFLSSFKSLQYITFMTGTDAGIPSQADEGDIARSWHKACPTLRTIILPRGQVWFHRSQQWKCLED